MPGARCTGRLACKIAKKRTRAYRFSGGNPAFPAQWFYGVLRAPGLFDTVACASSRRLDASIGASERHDLAVRVSTFVTRTAASTASRPTSVTCARPSEGRDQIGIVLIGPRRQSNFLKFRNRPECRRSGLNRSIDLRGIPISPRGEGEENAPARPGDGTAGDIVTALANRQYETYGRLAIPPVSGVPQMLAEGHQRLADKIWSVANKLRGPYRPPQYRKVMLPMIVLRRLDCVLEPTKDQVLKQVDALKAKKLSPEAIEKALAKVASKDRKQPLFNTSKYTFRKLLGEPSGIARNLTNYIKGFSPNVRKIFERFEFEAEIEKLDANNMLFEIIKEFSELDLHPDTVLNLEMGYLFEYLIRKFNEQANEEAGDLFTPREVIQLMARVLSAGDEKIHIPGIWRTIYDPACGTGGMLSVSEQYIREQNPQAHLTLFGQDYNDEAYAICCSDMLIKDEPVNNIVPGDTLGDGKTSDGHAGKTFHYMMANPPFGVEWKRQQTQVEKEYAQFGFDGRFGAGLPRINDGTLLFLQTMLAKRKPSPEEKGEGSKIAIVFNGSPLFTGDAGSGESNIRRWIIENDWLDAIIALPDQLFYNTVSLPMSGSFRTGSPSTASAACSLSMPRATT